MWHFHTMQKRSLAMESRNSARYLTSIKSSNGLCDSQHTYRRRLSRCKWQLDICGWQSTLKQWRDVRWGRYPCDHLFISRRTRATQQRRNIWWNRYLLLTLCNGGWWHWDGCRVTRWCWWQRRRKDIILVEHWHELCGAGDQWRRWVLTAVIAVILKQAAPDIRVIVKDSNIRCNIKYTLDIFSTLK